MFVIRIPLLILVVSALSLSSTSAFAVTPEVLSLETAFSRPGNQPLLDLIISSHTPRLASVIVQITPLDESVDVTTREWPLTLPLDTPVRLAVPADYRTGCWSRNFAGSREDGWRCHRRKGSAL